MGSEASCCGGGLSGNCLPVIHFIFQLLKPPIGFTCQSVHATTVCSEVSKVLDFGSGPKYLKKGSGKSQNRVF